MAGINDTLAQLEELARQGNLTEDSLRNLMNQTDDNTSIIEKFGDVTISAASGLNNFTKQVSSGTGSISSMNGAIDGLSTALGDAIPFIGGLVKGAGKVLTFAIDRLQTSFTSFQTLADIGAIGADGITGLRDDFSKAKIPLELYSTMLKKNSTDLSFIYGSSLKGSKMFAKTMKTMNETGNMQLRQMGFSVEQVADTVVNYQKIQARLGFAQELDQKKLAKSATAYGVELDLLAKLTGKSKDALQSEVNERMLDARYRANLSDMDADQADNIDNFIKQLSVYGKEFEKKGMAVFTKFAATAEGQQAAVEGTWPIMSKIFDKMRNGISVSSEEMRKATIEVGITAGKFSKGMSEVVGVIGNIGGAIPDFVSNVEASAMAMKMQRGLTISQIQEEQHRQKTGSDKTTKTIVDANQALLASATNLDKLSTSGEYATIVINKFSESMLWATDKLRDSFDLPLSEVKSTGNLLETAEVLKKVIKQQENAVGRMKSPSALKSAKSELAIITQKLNTLSSKELSSEIANLTNAINVAKKAVIERTAKQKLNNRPGRKRTKSIKSYNIDKNTEQLKMLLDFQKTKMLPPKTPPVEINLQAPNPENLTNNVSANLSDPAITVAPKSQKPAPRLDVDDYNIASTAVSEKEISNWDSEVKTTLKDILTQQANYLSELKNIANGISDQSTAQTTTNAILRDVVSATNNFNITSNNI